MKIQQQKPKNLKLDKKSKEGKTITTFYTFCIKLSDKREKKRTRSIKKYSRWLSECLKCFPFKRF